MAFSNAGCVETHTNSNGDLGKYAPAVPGMKTSLGRNCCTLAVYNKTAFEIGSGQIGMLAGFPETGKEK